MSKLWNQMCGKGRVRNSAQKWVDICWKVKGVITANKKGNKTLAVPIDDIIQEITHWGSVEDCIIICKHVKSECYWHIIGDAIEEELLDVKNPGDLWREVAWALLQASVDMFCHDVGVNEIVDE